MLDAEFMKKPKKIASLLPFLPVSLLAFGGLLLAIQSACSAGTANSGTNNGQNDGTCGYEYYGVCYDDYYDYAYGGGSDSTSSTAPSSTSTASPAPTATSSSN